MTSNYFLVGKYNRLGISILQTFNFEIHPFPRALFILRATSHRWRTSLFALPAGTKLQKFGHKSAIAIIKNASNRLRYLCHHKLPIKWASAKKAHFQTKYWNAISSQNHHETRWGKRMGTVVYLGKPYVLFYGNSFWNDKYRYALVCKYWTYTKLYYFIMCHNPPNI